MKLRNTFFVGLITIAGFTSCVSEEQKSSEEKLGTGRMVLDVSMQQPESITRTQTEVTDFPVEIVGENGYSKTYATVSDVPSTVDLLVGTYTVTSHSNLVLKPRMNEPYYKGSSTMLIRNNVTTHVDVVCKMLNSLISVSYNQDFLDTFDSWTVTINDADATGLLFSNETATSYYWYFENQVEDLKVDFVGYRKDGTKVEYREILTKSEDTIKQYGDDSKYYHGGDEIAINFGAATVETATGEVTKITINAYVTFSEATTPVELEVVDAEPGDEPHEPGGEPGDDEVITLNLPKDMVVSGSTDPDLGNTFIKCEKGIKSIKVRIESSSEEMVESLGDLNTNYGVDFITGAEVVENTDLVALFEDLGQDLTVPSVNDEEYTFPIGNFFGLLVFLSGDHTFYLTIEDMEGNTKSGVLVLTVE